MNDHLIADQSMGDVGIWANVAVAADMNAVRR